MSKDQYTQVEKEELNYKNTDNIGIRDFTYSLLCALKFEEM